MDKCGVGEGDCDENYECKQGLFCGSNNCGSNNHDSDDCCQEGKTLMIWLQKKGKKSNIRCSLVWSLRLCLSDFI